jgi:hypothetical protein
VCVEGRPEILSVLVGKTSRTDDGAGFRVPVELRGVDPEGRSVVHARADVVLATTAPQAGPAAPMPDLPAYGRPVRSIYHDVLFHGPELQGIERVEALGPAGLTALVKTSAAPGAWVERPLRQTWLIDPLAVDCAFQLLSLWCHEQAGAPSLPTRVGRYVSFRRSFPTPRVKVVARVARPGEHRAVATIDFLDADGALVARIEDYECVVDASLAPAFRRNRLGSSVRSAQGPR